MIYWITKESEKVFSSSQNDFINKNNKDYVAWLNDGNLPISILEADLTLLRIKWLEDSVTPRRIREAIIGEDNGWLADIESQITVLRAQL